MITLKAIVMFLVVISLTLALTFFIFKSMDEDDGGYLNNLLDDEFESFDALERSLIVGGYEIEEGSRPYLVYIKRIKNDGYGKGSICGGSLISPHTVLTAAHCVVDRSGYAKGYSLTLGINAHSRGNDTIGEWRVVENYMNASMIHPGYNLEGGFVDAAIIFLNESVTSVQPVRLNEDPNIPADGAPLDVSGWGDTSGWGGSSSDIARAVTVYAMDNEKCMSDPFQYENGTITDEMMCVFNEDGKSNCKGDSGGPHVLGNGGRKEEGPAYPFLQVGIVSWGKTSDEVPCNSSEYPRVVTRVSSIASWIKETVCNETMELCDDVPSDVKTKKPISKPTKKPTSKPTKKPTSKFTKKPTSKPTKKPTSKSTKKPTSKSTKKDSISKVSSYVKKKRVPLNVSQ